MASVLFSTVGQAVGGPLGAGIGAAVGGSVDGALLARGRRGPGDLFAPQSSYGSVVPRLFGVSRAAGHLIWALPVAPGGQSKGSGRPAVTSSFAIALSTGPVVEVRRIWADGREIRDGAGLFERDTEMRLTSVGGGAADPLVAAAEGAGLAPAFQGLSYVVFEELQLGPFGNRIPALTFEVVADLGTATSWLAVLAGQASVGAAEAGGGAGAASGYAAFADRLSSDLEVLASVADAPTGFSDGGLAFQGRPRVFDIEAGELLAAAQLDSAQVTLSRREAAASIGLSYMDPAREYQVGRQFVGRGRTGQAIDVVWPVVAEAEAARDLASRLLRRAEAGSERLKMSLPWRWMALQAGDQLRFGDRRLWRILRRDVVGMEIRIEAERVSAFSDSQRPSADPGRTLPAPAVRAGPTVLQAFEVPVPVFGEGPSVLARAGGGSSWRGAEVRLLSAGSETELGVAPRGTCAGRLGATLDWSAETIWDLQNAVVVEAPGAESAFQSASSADVLAGANLLKVGAELLQYRDVERVSADVVRLRGLLRGRYGTAFRALGTWGIGTEVLQVSVAGPAAVPVLADAIGRQLVLLGAGPGDGVGGVEALHTVEGLGLAPLAPVHVVARRDPGGGLEFGWTPRFRDGWAWGSAEAPVDSAALTYQWLFFGDDQIARALMVTGVSLVLDAGEQVALFGGLLPTGQFAVEAVGEGPTDLRRSVLARI